MPRPMIPLASEGPRSFTLSPAGWGRGKGEGADEPVRGAAHLTLPPPPYPPTPTLFPRLRGKVRSGPSSVP